MGIDDPAQIPSRSVLADMIVEMRNLAAYQAAELMGQCKQRGFTHDGTTGREGKMVTGCVSGEGDHEGAAPRVLSMGCRTVADGGAREGATAVMMLVETLADAAFTAGEHALAARLNMTIFNVGSQHDHNAGEDAIDDILEEEIELICRKTVHGWFEKTREEQRALVRITRHYCFAHKIDNLAKAVVAAFDGICADGGFLPPADAGNRHSPPSFTNYIHAAHKLVGVKMGKANGEQCNIHT
eukprot:60445-Rhodomonas_salina.1